MDKLFLRMAALTVRLKSFINRPPKESGEIGVALNRLRISRNKADYDNTIVSLLADSESALDTASRIMELLKEIYPDL